MRVLFLTHSFPRYEGDAAGSFVLRLATALAREGVEVRVIAPATVSAPAKAVIEGIPVSRFRYAPRRLETLAYEGNMASQVRASWGARIGLVGMLGAELGAAVGGWRARGQNAELIHAHWWFPSGLVGAVAARVAGVPLVTTLHGTDIRLARSIAVSRPALRQVMKRSARITAVSNWLATAAQEMAGGDLPLVAPMPVAIELFSPDLGVARGDSLLFVGRLTVQKGVDLLLRALLLLPRQIGLDIVGDGDEQARLKALAQSLGVSDRVRWHGARPVNQLAPFYRAASVLVVPSEEEGLGLVAVEAQLCDTPVVAFASGGVVDVVQDGTSGVLVHQRTAEALAQGIRCVLDRSDRGAALGRTGAARARDTFSPRSVAQRYLTIYQDAVGSAAG
jgi:glycosyltransferase involved in cell wall biosynthesis